MEIGNKVEVVSVSRDLPENDLETKSLFQSCIGRVFPIVGFQGHLLELEVGEVLGEQPYMQSIWIEPEHVRLVNH